MRFSFSSGVRNDLLLDIKEALYGWGIAAGYTPANAAFSITAGPHASTNRVVFTVPAGQQAVVLCASMTIQRVTTASAVNTATASWVADKGGPSQSRFCRASIGANVVGTSVFHSVNPGLYLDTGDTLTMDTVDLSTGGTVLYDGTALIALFDK